MATPIDNTNKTSNFYRVEGKTKIIEVLFSASVAAEQGGLVYPNPGAAGQWTVADSTAGNAFGVIQQTIASTDSDYASTKRVKVEVPAEPGVIWRGTAGGALAQTHEGTYVDLTDYKTVNEGASSKKVIYVHKYKSATEGLFMLAGNVPAGLAMAATS